MNKLIFKSSFLVAVILVISIFHVWGNDSKENKKIITRTVKIDKHFSGLVSYAALEITYTQNNEDPIAVITGPADIVEGMTWKINSNNILSFQYPKKKNNTGKVTVKLNGGLLTNYEASSSGIIRVATDTKSNKNLNFAVSSLGKIIMQGTAAAKEAINIAASSSAEMTFNKAVVGGVANIAASSSSLIKLPSLSSAPLNYSGSSMGILEVNELTSTTANITLSSGGEFSTAACNIGTVNLDASSGGDASFGNVVAKTLNMSVSSGATVKMKGTCNNANFSAASAGQINAKGMKIERLNTRKTSSGGSINL